MYQTNPELPTMYDLPSENPEEPGWSDVFHPIQSWLLDDTFYPPDYPKNQMFTCGNLNVYYDLQHTQWHKRPDWFAVLGVNNLYENRDLRLSYVIWQEQVSPLIVVELLSPETEDEDLGTKLRDSEQPPSKWEVYEQILKIPYYAIFNRYNSEFQLFELKGGRYIKANLSDNRFWIPELKLGLGLWQGRYKEEIRQEFWLRWYDATGNWILTPYEFVKLENQRAEAKVQRVNAERQRAEAEMKLAEDQRLQNERLIAQLRSLGFEADSI